LAVMRGASLNGDFRCGGWSTSHLASCVQTVGIPFADGIVGPGRSHSGRALPWSGCAFLWLRGGMNKGCTFYSWCGWYETLRLWGQNLSEDRIWPRDTLDAAECLIFISLACLSRHCPDMAIRAYAREQLRDRYWDRQRAMGIRVVQ